MWLKVWFELGQLVVAPVLQMEKEKAQEKEREKLFLNQSSLDLLYPEDTLHSRDFSTVLGRLFH
jgi:hypothetical protein